MMRALGVDLGLKRVGLAISDPSGTLARPLTTLRLGGGRPPDDAVEGVLGEISRLSAEDDGLELIVVGWPTRLDGSETEATRHVASFVEALSARTSIPVVTEGERLTSHEAETRLAARERDWRKRKAQLDAAAAAIILQDYLDRHAS